MPSDNGGKTPEEMALERAFKGGVVNLSEFHRQDGLLAESIDKAGRHGEGVIQTFIHAQTEDKNYRQILKHALWKSREEMDKAAIALAVCKITGAKNAAEFILDRITAHSAGIDFQLMHESYEALTHTTFTTDYSHKKGWSNDKSKDGSRSPIS